MINNRWLVELFGDRLSGNESIKTNSDGLFGEIDNASSWNSPAHWKDTRIYSWKQLHERAVKAYMQNEERRKKRLDDNEKYE
jgi:hypothetical protein